MPNRNEVQALVGQRRYTRRQVLNGFGAGAIALSAAYLRACTACQPTPPSVVVVGSVLKVRPKDRPSGSNDAKLLAAKNEFESLQIVIQAGSNPLRNVNVALCTPLSGPGGSMIPAKNVTIYREDYHQVTVKSDQEGDTGPWPDALIPAQDPWHGHQRNAFPIDVPANENRVAWIDVLVPQEAAPGQYSRSIKVTATDFNANVPIQLAVLNATLPSTPSLTSAFFWISTNFAKPDTAPAASMSSTKSATRRAGASMPCLRRLRWTTGSRSRTHGTNLRWGETCRSSGSIRYPCSTERPRRACPVLSSPHYRLTSAA